MNKLAVAKETFRSWGKVNTQLVRYIIPQLNGWVLDVGCARGEYVRVLLKYCKVYGCDIFSWAEWRVQGRGRFCQADVVRLPFADHSFNSVLALNVLEHIEPIQKALRELKRLARERIIIAVPNCQTDPEMEWAGLSYFHWVDRTHCQFFNPSSLRNLLEENGFEVESLEFFGNVRPEVLLLRSFRVPIPLTRVIAWMLQKVPWRKKYAPLLVAVARPGDKY